MTARILARDRLVHQHFRDSFFEHKPWVQQNDSFEQIFECPADENFTPEPNKAARDLEECCRLYYPPSTTGLTPMERFEWTTPTGDSSYVVCHNIMEDVMRASNDPIPSHSEQSAPAEDSAEKHTTIPRLGSPDSETTMRAPNDRSNKQRSGESWLESDSDSTVSTAGDGASTPRQFMADDCHVDTGEMVRALISTFGTIG
jgi:hypothetical protein